jgi:hypothetical protein
LDGGVIGVWKVGSQARYKGCIEYLLVSRCKYVFEFHESGDVKTDSVVVAAFESIELMNNAFATSSRGGSVEFGIKRYPHRVRDTLDTSKEGSGFWTAGTIDIRNSEVLTLLIFKKASGLILGRRVFITKYNVKGACALK